MKKVRDELWISFGTRPARFLLLNSILNINHLKNLKTSREIFEISPIFPTALLATPSTWSPSIIRSNSYLKVQNFHQNHPSSIAKISAPSTAWNPANLMQLHQFFHLLKHKIMHSNIQNLFYSQIEIEFCTYHNHYIG